MMPSCCFWGCVHMYTAILENSFFSVLLKLFMCGWGKWRCFLATSKVCTIASCLAWSLLVFSFSWRQWYFLRNTCVREDTVQHKINSLFKYSIGMMNIITEFLCKTQLYYFRYYWIFTFLALVPQFSLICFSSTQIIIFWLLGKANSPVRLERMEGLKTAVVEGQQSRMEWDGRLWETSETGKWKTEQIS